MKIETRLALLCLLCACSGSLMAQWATDPTVANNRVCTAIGAQSRAFVVPDFSGGVISVWEDYRSNPTAADLYFERLDANGNTAWSVPGSYAGKKLCATAKQRSIDRVISDGSGGFYIAWDQYNGSNFDVYAQRIDASGNQLWGSDGIAVCTAANDQYQADLVTDASGNIIITWLDLRNDPLNARAWQTYAQRITTAGAVSWAANGVQVSSSLSFPIGIVSDNAGGAIIAYIDARNSGVNASNNYTNTDVYAQRINSSGTAQWAANGVAVCTQAKNQTQESMRPGTSVVSDDLGGIIICWSDYRNDPNNGLANPYRADYYAQKLNGSGVAQWAANGIAICAVTGGDLYNTLAMPDGMGGVIAAWFDMRSSPSGAVYTQRINASGTAVYTTNGIAMVTSQTHNLVYDLVQDGLGNAIMVYDTNEDRIFSTKFLISSGTISAAAHPVCNRTAVSVVPTIASDLTGDAFVAWEDYRNDAAYPDIYAFKRFGTGVLPVSLTRFSAGWQQTDALVQWQMANEVNIGTYNVQRSYNASTFETIAMTQAKNNSQNQSYSTLDNTLNADAPNIFYRLQWQQQNGRVHYSPVVKLSGRSSSPKAILMPNPVANNTWLHITSEKTQNVSVRIVGQTGAVVSTGIFGLVKGDNILQVSVANLPAGLYRLEWMNANTNNSLPFVKF